MKAATRIFFEWIMLLLGPCFPFVAEAQTPPLIVSDSLQSILNGALPSGFAQSGCIMRVESPGQWVWEGAVGSAIAGITSGEPQTDATPAHHFRVGSITKMMVATCILKLEEQGMLDINDAIDDYLSASLIVDTIQASDTVRIRHLLNHTSGIANSADNPTCQMDVLSDPLGAHTLPEAVYCGASQGELAAPGTDWSYSNTNYSLLAMIIEQVTGMSYQQYITQNLFEPLNLDNTFIPASPQITSAHMGCYWDLGTWTDLTVIHPTTYTGWADVVSTTADLIKFYKELKAGNIINSTQLATMYTIDAASFGYGLGLDFWTFSGTDYVGHYGEVANTSGLFFCDINSPLAPDGFYISYNFNVQGAAMQADIDNPVIQFLRNPSIGIEENTASTFRIYPNPAEDVIHIDASGNPVNEVRLFDVYGKELNRIDVHGRQDLIAINIEHLNSGIYLIAVSGNKGIHTQRILVR